MRLYARSGILEKPHPLIRDYWKFQGTRWNEVLQVSVSARLIGQSLIKFHSLRFDCSCLKCKFPVISLCVHRCSRYVEFYVWRLFSIQSFVVSDRAQSKFTILIFQLLEDSATENSYTRVTVYLENVEKLFCVFYYEYSTRGESRAWRWCLGLKDNASDFLCREIFIGTPDMTGRKF